MSIGEATLAPHDFTRIVAEHVTEITGRRPAETRNPDDDGDYMFLCQQYHLWVAFPMEKLAGIRHRSKTAVVLCITGPVHFDAGGDIFAEIGSIEELRKVEPFLVQHWLPLTILEAE